MLQTYSYRMIQLMQPMHHSNRVVTDDFWGNQQNCLYAVIEKDAYTLGQFTDFEVSFTFA